MSDRSVSRAIFADLRKLGVSQGDTLLVHSSLRSLGHVDGGAETVIAALREALGEDGTLLMPALSYAYVGQGQPLFSARWTGCCVGTIPETFRRMPGTVRSVHPTHSVSASGARAEEFTARHHLDRTPVGENSPFALLPRMGGRILMLGCGLLPNTSMHGVEERVEPPYLFVRDRVTYVICGEREQQVVQHRRHNFKGYAQRYDRIAPLMDDGIRSGRVLEADCHLLDAGTLWRVGEAALRRDPMFFVQRLEA